MLLYTGCPELQGLLQVYKDGKKVSEHVASETGTAALPKVAQCMKSPTVLLVVRNIGSTPAC